MHPILCYPSHEVWRWRHSKYIKVVEFQKGKLNRNQKRIRSQIMYNLLPLSVCLSIWLSSQLSFRWLKASSLSVEAVCGYPSELRGQSVMEEAIFKNCSVENAHSFNKTSVPTKAPTPNKPMQTTTKDRPVQSEPNPKPAKTKLTAAPKKHKFDELKPVRALKKKNRPNKKRGRRPRSSMKSHRVFYLN